MKLDQPDRDLLDRVIRNLSIAEDVAHAIPGAHVRAVDNRVLENSYLVLGEILHESARKLGRRALALHLDAALADMLGTPGPDGKPGT